MARFDVVLPVRNGEDYLDESIRSVMTQTERDWRLIVIDHASTDGTAGIVERLRREDPRIELYHADASLVQAEVRDYGFSLCNAPFVMLQDHDDISYPTRMADQHAMLQRMPELVLVGGSYDFIDEHGRLTGHRTLPTDPARLSAAFLFNNPIAHPAVMLRPDALSALGLSYSRSTMSLTYGVTPIQGEGVAQDYLLFGQLGVLGLCGNVEGRVIRYRRHAASISSTKRDLQVELSFRYARHFMDLVAARYGVPACDPVPFSNFAAKIVPSDGTDLAAAFEEMQETVIGAFGDGAGVRRELAFRSTLAVRGAAALLARFTRFALSHRPESDEIATMRVAASEWLRGRRTAA